MTRELKIVEGSKVTRRDLIEMFRAAGFDINEIQVNEIYKEMDSGKSFNHEKF